MATTKAQQPTAQKRDDGNVEPKPKWLPLTSTLVCAAVVIVVALQVYRITLAPTVTLVDSGELIVAAKTLGVAHPPGVPLYVILAHLATFLPIGSVAARVNFASGIFAALAAAFVSLLVFEALRGFPLANLTTPAKSRKEKRAEKRHGKAPAQLWVMNPVMTVAVAAMSGLIFAFSRTLWSYATIAEVY